MAYEKIGWEDYPSTKTPVTKTNLNKMDDQIFDNAEAIEALAEKTDEDISDLQTDLEGAKTTLNGKISKNAEDIATIQDVVDILTAMINVTEEKDGIAFGKAAESGKMSTDYEADFNTVNATSVEADNVKASSVDIANKESHLNGLINSLSEGSSAPTDSDFYVAQYAGGGSSTTTYHRRPVSALWNYIQGKISSVLGLSTSGFKGTFISPNAAGFKTNAYGNFQHQSTTASNTWGIVSNNGTAVFTVNYESGAVMYGKNCNLPKIICGNTTATSSSGTHISFGSMFSSAPQVICGYRESGSAAVGDRGSLKVYNIAASGCDVIIGGSSDSTARPISWVAIGS